MCEFTTLFKNKPEVVLPQVEHQYSKNIASQNAL